MVQGIFAGLPRNRHELVCESSGLESIRFFNDIPSVRQNDREKSLVGKPNRGDAASLPQVLQSWLGSWCHSDDMSTMHGSRSL